MVHISRFSSQDTLNGFISLEKWLRNELPDPNHSKGLISKKLSLLALDLYLRLMMSKKAFVTEG